MASEDQVLMMDMLGFGCTSCAYAIEKIGRKIDGVKSVSVDLAKHEIRIIHHGDAHKIAGELRSMVSRIGHDVLERPA